MGFWNNGRDAANKGHKAVDTKNMSAVEHEKTVAAKKYQEQQNAKKKN